jgi:hypothetical protein
LQEAAICCFAFAAPGPPAATWAISAMYPSSNGGEIVSMPI